MQNRCGTSALPCMFSFISFETMSNCLHLVRNFANYPYDQVNTTIFLNECGLIKSETDPSSTTESPTEMTTGNATLLTANTNAFFEDTLSNANKSIKVTCCHANQSIEVKTCGFGASCEGKCTAINAYLCPSGNCTGEIRDCEYDFDRENGGDEPDESSSIATEPSSSFNWCSPRCPVVKHKACCFNPKCFKKKSERCKFISFLTGMVNHI